MPLRNRFVFIEGYEYRGVPIALFASKRKVKWFYPYSGKWYGNYELVTKGLESSWEAKKIFNEQLFGIIKKTIDRLFGEIK
jgi:hypothetical protein